MIPSHELKTNFFQKKIIMQAQLLDEKMDPVIMQAQFMEKEYSVIVQARFKE
jgi:hypothetical protein